MSYIENYHDQILMEYQNLMMAYNLSILYETNISLLLTLSSLYFYPPRHCLILLLYCINSGYELGQILGFEAYADYVDGYH